MMGAAAYLKLAYLKLAMFLGLWAEIDAARALGGRRSSFNFDAILSWLVCIVCAAAAAWLLSRAVAHYRRRYRNSTRALFHELCRVHGLERHDRALLSELARAARLAHPGQLFLEAERFSSEAIPAELQPQAESLERLRSRLFGDGTPESPAGEEPAIAAVT